MAGYLGSNYLAHAPGNDAPGAVIVDNSDAGFSATGTWPASSIVGGHLGADYRTHEPNGEPPAAILIDNGSPGTTATGPWPASTAVTGYAGTNYQTQPAGTGANSYTWSANLRGQRDLFSHLPRTNHAVLFDCFPFHCSLIASSAD